MPNKDTFFIFYFYRKQTTYCTFLKFYPKNTLTKLVPAIVFIYFFAVVSQ